MPQSSIKEQRDISEDKVMSWEEGVGTEHWSKPEDIVVFKWTLCSEDQVESSTSL